MNSPQSSSLASEKLPLKWYAVYTYPNHERAVVDQLQAKGVETFLPVTLVERRRKDRHIRFQAPIFPRYVFIRIDLNKRIKILCSSGVVRILSCNGRPMPIDDKEIDGVKLCLEKISVFRMQPLLEIGTRVRVRSGILQGLEGFVTSCKRDKRLIVPISLTHQAISFEIDNDLLDQLELDESNSTLIYNA